MVLTFIGLEFKNPEQILFFLVVENEKPSGKCYFLKLEIRKAEQVFAFLTFERWKTLVGRAFQGVETILERSAACFR